MKRRAYLGLLILVLLVLALARTLVDAVARATTLLPRRLTNPKGA